MIEILRKYFPDKEEAFFQQIELAVNCYKEWNEKINVISRKDIEQIYLHHFLHSLSIIKSMEFPTGSRFIDAGTGGGFPGIPMAIALPDCEFLLVDSIGKKLKVVEEVCLTANIKNVRTLHSRVESIKEKCDFVTGRAVETLKEFYDHTQHLVDRSQKNKPKGILYLKGGDVNDEVKELRKKVEQFDIYQLFPEEYFETKKLIFIPL